MRTVFNRSRLLVVALLVGAMFVVFAGGVAPTFAQDALETAGTAAGLQSTPLPVVIGRIIAVILGLMGVVLLGLLIYAGFLWMTAGGNAEQVGKAKRVITQAVIGLILILSSFAITNFVVTRLTGGQGIFGGGAGGITTGGGVSTEPFSGSLGSGAIRDHFPARGATDVPRNTKIFVTFKDAMDIPSFISDYSTNGTPFDQTDDTVGSTLNTANVKIYATANGETTALAGEEVSVQFTENLRTFVFDPPILGSNSEDVQYTVALKQTIKNISDKTILPAGGYVWNFSVGTTIDLTPPHVVRVTPRAEGTYDRNIVVQIDFSEAVDPTSATGIFDPADVFSDFSNIETINEAGSKVAGTYSMSNEYKTVTFVTSDLCGENSCGDAVYCLPGNDAINVTIHAATPGLSPPQTDSFPYDGVVDTTGNALDGNNDGTAGDAYAWSFNTTDDVNLTAPQILSITPDILGESVPLDQKVTVRFNDVMNSSSLSSETISLTSNPVHELWYNVSRREVTAGGEEPDAEDGELQTEITMRHGVFLRSDETTTYSYGVNISSDIRNAYQNCYNPAQGPGEGGGTCNTSASEPYCCNGVPSSSACILF